MTERAECGLVETLVAQPSVEALDERVLDRLSGLDVVPVDAYAPARVDLSEDFPLRGSVACACCKRPLTACWSTSKTGARHPYYSCFTKGCERSRKSIRRDQLEGAFVTLLDSLTPAPRLFDLTRAMFRNAWNQRLAQAHTIAKSCDREIETIEKQIASLLDRIVDASSHTVVAAYEKRIATLERSKLVLAEKRESAGPRQGTFEELFELAFGFLANPSKLWHSGKIEYRKLVLRLTFADHLAYCPDGGFRTPKTTLPFRSLSDMKSVKSRMAGGSHQHSREYLE